MLTVGRAVLVVGLAVAAAACAGSGSGAGSGPAAAAVAPDGLFTRAQSSRGEAVFLGQCASCHAQREFSARTFGLSWDGKPVGELFHFIRTAMPFGKPGSLTAEQYADVTAYLLQLNGYPAGPTELPADTAALNRVPFRQGN